MATIKSKEISISEKMNQMEWLARNSEFLSPDQVSKCLSAYKQLFDPKHPDLRNAYITAHHSSKSIAAIIALLEGASKLERNEETTSKLAMLLSIVEPLILNDKNLEIALKYATTETMIDLLQIPPHVKSQAEEGKISMPMYVKHTIRCVTSCIRHPGGVQQIVTADSGISSIIQFFELVQDEEIIANCSKMIRILLREEQVSLRTV